MGNAIGSLRAAGQQARRKLPSAPAPGESELLSRIEAHEQARMRDLPAAEDLSAKDEPLGQMLSRISSAIKPRVQDISSGQVPGSTGEQQASQPQGAAATGTQPHAVEQGGPHGAGQLHGQGTPEPKPAGTMPHGGLSVDQLARRHGQLSAAARQGQADDSEPGRLQAYILREVLEAKNAAEAEGTALDLTPYVQSHRASAEQLQVLFKHCAIPLVGRFKTFGHEYGFARPPPWWLPPNDQSFGAMFRSEAAVLESAAQAQAPDQALPEISAAADTAPPPTSPPPPNNPQAELPRHAKQSGGQ